MKLWFPIIVPALAALAQQSVNYALVALECRQQERLPLHFVAAVALVVTLIGAAIAWGRWREAGMDEPEDRGEQRTRTRFLAIVGFWVSALMALAVAAQWLTSAFVSPCVQ
ncbi:MAG TPA: hypothetical protein VHP37_22675 [Burkholderiales bacterium]|nr:hypothetical protein [Burkholderiales bacterium]